LLASRRQWFLFSIDQCSLTILASWVLVFSLGSRLVMKKRVSVFSTPVLLSV
jgi:hypothetical protein